MGRMDDNTPNRDRDNTPLQFVSKTIRAVSTLVVFGIPLAIGTAVMAGYGAYAAYKRLKRQRP